MHCLLCHEKIPRLRAWTGKSEFCCDEHSDLYKKQTIERLLIEESAPEQAASPLPIPSADTSSVDHILMGQSSSQSKLPEGKSGSAEIDELWKLADKIGATDAEAQSEQPSQKTSAAPEAATTAEDAGEDALAALLSLAEESSASAAQPVAKPEPLDELARLEPSPGGLPQLDSLPVELAVESGDVGIEDAPELQLDALELAEPEEALTPPEIFAEFAEEQSADLNPPEPEVAQLAADPPELSSFEAATDTADNSLPIGKPAAKVIAKKKRPTLRASLAMRKVDPAAFLPEGGYPLKPWTDALEIAGPDRVSLLGPLEPLGLRKSSLNGTASGTFDPVVFRATEKTAPISFPVPDPQATAPVEDESTVLLPTELMAWPDALHVALRTAEMKFQEPPENGVVDGSPAMQPTPSMSEEFLCRVALVNQILEPSGSVILTPPEKDVFASDSAEEDSSESYALSAGFVESEETDGGERNNVADLF